MYSTFFLYKSTNVINRDARDLYSDFLFYPDIFILFNYIYKGS